MEFAGLAIAKLNFNFSRSETANFANMFNLIERSESKQRRALLIAAAFFPNRAKRSFDRGPTNASFEYKRLPTLAADTYCAAI
jgi:hypothetical protein